MVSTGAIYLDRTDKKKVIMEKISAVAVILILFLFVYLLVSDYISYPNPNNHECKIGVKEGICPEGTICEGMMVACENSDIEFKYFFTDWVFDKPVCRNKMIYKELCVKKP